MLWIEGDRTDVSVWWGNRYTKAEFHERLNARRRRRSAHVVCPAGHMLHHDRPEDIAEAARGVPVRIAPFTNRAEQTPTMDVEHINAIGNRLADLTKRTVDLRGYL